MTKARVEPGCKFYGVRLGMIQARMLTDAIRKRCGVTGYVQREECLCCAAEVYAWFPLRSEVSEELTRVLTEICKGVDGNLRLTWSLEFYAVSSVVSCRLAITRAT